MIFRRLALTLMMVVAGGDFSFAKVYEIGPCVTPRQVWDANAKAGWTLSAIGRNSQGFSLLFSNGRTSQIWIFVNNNLCLLDPAALWHFKWTPTKEKGA